MLNAARCATGARRTGQSLDCSQVCVIETGAGIWKLTCCTLSSATYSPKLWPQHSTAQHWFCALGALDWTAQGVMLVTEAELWAVGAAEQCTAHKLKADSGASLKPSVWMPTCRQTNPAAAADRHSSDHPENSATATATARRLKPQ